VHSMRRKNEVSKSKLPASNSIVKVTGTISNRLYVLTLITGSGNMADTMMNVRTRRVGHWRLMTSDSLAIN